MAQLDPVLHAPGRTGPTRDYKAIAAREPVYRQERFQLAPQRLPVSLNANMRARPHARSGTGNPAALDLPMKRVPVLVRHSNQRPIEAGDGVEASSWGVSDPSQHEAERRGAMLPGMGQLANFAAGTAGAVALGLVVGGLAYLCIKGKRK